MASKSKLFGSRPCQIFQVRGWEYPSGISIDSDGFISRHLGGNNRSPNHDNCEKLFRDERTRPLAMMLVKESVE